MLKKYNVYKDWEPFEHYNEETERKSIYFEKVNRHKEVEQSKTHLKVDEHLKFDEIRSPRSPSHSKPSPDNREHK